LAAVFAAGAPFERAHITLAIASFATKSLRYIKGAAMILEGEAWSLSRRLVVGQTGDLEVADVDVEVEWRGQVSLWLPTTPKRCEP